MTPTTLNSLLSGRHGSFYEYLAKTYQHADPDNRARIERVWGDEIDRVVQKGHPLIEILELHEDGEEEFMLFPLITSPAQRG